MDEIKSERCINCDTIYTFKKGMPKICWICGFPTDERIEDFYDN